VPKHSGMIQQVVVQAYLFAAAGDVQSQDCSTYRAQASVSYGRPALQRACGLSPTPQLLLLLLPLLFTSCRLAQQLQSLVWWTWTQAPTGAGTSHG
jgi:hypothetical protein